MPDCRYWAVIPAAGAGRRMGAKIPKQYLSLMGRSVIAHTLSRFCGHPRISGVVAVISKNDTWWPEIRRDVRGKPMRVYGGAQRCHSVVNGLLALQGKAGPQDWVLVHDAVRPCVRTGDIDRLMDVLADHPVGGVLGLQVRDTMKRTDAANAVYETVPREGLWHALTPQMFRLNELLDALQACIGRGSLVTDEAQAMEQAGARPMMVEGHEDNIKITRPADLALAELYLASQTRGGP